MDVHEGTATVREAMRFSAYLRQPPEVPKEEKDQYVEEMIEVLELQDLADRSAALILACAQSLQVVRVPCSHILTESYNVVHSLQAS